VRHAGVGPSGPGSTWVRVFTLGRDGLPGGAGEDGELDNPRIEEGKI
jgi:hypothetical protein